MLRLGPLPSAPRSPHIIPASTLALTATACIHIRFVPVTTAHAITRFFYTPHFLLPGNVMVKGTLVH